MEACDAAGEYQIAFRYVSGNFNPQTKNLIDKEGEIERKNISLLEIRREWEHKNIRLLSSLKA